MSAREPHDLDKMLAAMPRARLSRRELLRRAGIGAGALSMSAWLAACGIGGEDDNGTAANDNGLTTTEVQGELDFANWPAYIDKVKGESPTLLDFERATGITVNYETAISDNLTFFQTIREPLANGDPTGWDLIVVTDWLVDKMAKLGYLEKLDHSKLSNFDTNAAEIYKDPNYDPGNAHSIPWQSGITGIGYNIELTGREITSTMELFNPEFEGKVGMFTEMRDTMNLILLATGVNPQEATIDDAEEVQKMLLEQRDSGILRAYYGNEYLQPLAQGDLAICIAWSGDIVGKTFSADPKVRFAVPDEGGILWVDNMCIPEGAEHPIDAHEMMNFVYDPQIAAQMTAWINYISPVPEAQEILASSDVGYDRKVAASPLVFPTPDMESRLHEYKILEEEEEEQWNNLFDEVVQG